MKKLFFIFAVITMFLITSYSAYAGSPGSESSFEITSGVSLDKVQSTFDSSRTISGFAEEGTIVKITLSSRNASGELTEYATYEMEVGASSIFSQSVDLELGENVIVITSEFDGEETASEEAVIKRKKREIKTELENSISIPGLKDSTEEIILDLDEFN